MQETYRKNFNPLPRKEGDYVPYLSYNYGYYFNPLPRKEGDIHLQTHCSAYSYFNPLPRKEGDAHVAFVTKVIEKIFQSTPS